MIFQLDIHFHHFNARDCDSLDMRFFFYSHGCYRRFLPWIAASYGIWMSKVYNAIKDKMFLTLMAASTWCTRVMKVEKLNKSGAIDKWRTALIYILEEKMKRHTARGGAPLGRSCGRSRLEPHQKVVSPCRSAGGGDARVTFCKARSSRLFAE